MSEEQELGIGREADPQIVAQYGLYPDSAIQRFMRAKGQEMARISHRPTIPYTFRVLDADVINAFATPGYVYFTRGIMAHLNDEAQFAGVLGHEIGHITARHAVSQQTKGTGMQLGLLLGMILSPQIAQMGEQASQGLQLMMLKFSRDDESQSDELGVEYSTKIGYDASHMADFFQTLKRNSEASNSDGLPEMLSSHPDPGNRYERVHQLAEQYQKANNITNPKINRDSYLQLINGMIYGEDPKQGYVENNVFYHPEMKFKFSTPQGWRYQNSPQQVQFAPQDGSAMMFLSSAPGNSLQEAAQNFAQQAGLQVLQSQQININGFPAIVYVGDQVQQNQQTGQAQATGVRAMVHVIQSNSGLLQFVGATSAQNFANYQRTFQGVAQSFSTLTDQSKINKKPERVRIKKASQTATLQSLLQANNIPQRRYEELAILNGMQLNTSVPAGTSYKIISE